MFDIIYHHDDWQGQNFGLFVGDTWNRLRQSWTMPPFPEFRGNEPLLAAYINEGRWIVECPEGCGHAVVPERDNPTYLCLSPPHVCPAPKRWYRVQYPRQKKAIEGELLKRDAKRPFYATNRHWKPGESLAQLRVETAAGGSV